MWHIRKGESTMYEEEREGQTFKSIFLKIVLVVLLLFVLMMLFPTKGFVTNYVDKKVSGTSNFNNNLLAMATAASGYFNSSRLPENTNDTAKLTLKEMYSKKIITRFTDSNSKSCDVTKSYALVTKKKDEYTMKVNLSCSDKTDYIMLHMGLDDTSFPSTSTARCEFVKNLDEAWAYGDWSSWGTDKIEESSTIQVETKVSKIKTGTKSVPKTNTISKQTTPVKYNGNYVYVCASSYDNAGTYQSPTTCYKTETTYYTEDVYKYVTYYRSRSKTLTESSTDTKWSSCDDESLINEGYAKTGQTKA